MTDLALHPDGERVVYAVGWADRDTDSNRSQLWLHARGNARQLTFGHADTAPRISPDGRWLAYLSALPREPAQLKLLPLDGGEPRTVTALDDGCGDPVWLPDSSRLIVSAPTRPENEIGLSRDQLAKSPKIRRIDVARYRYNGRGWTWNRWRHLFVVGLDNNPPTQLTDGPWDDVSPAVDPVAGRVAFLSARHDDSDLVSGSQVWTVPLSGGAATPVVEHGAWSAIHWLDTGDLLLIGSDTVGEVRLASPWLAAPHGPPRRLGDGETAVLALATPLASGVAEVDDAVLLAGIRRGRSHIDRYPFDGSPASTVIGGDVVVGAFAANRGGRVVHTASTPTQPFELFDGDQQLTSLNAELLAEIEPSTPTEFETAAADGYPVHGWIYRPPASALPSGAGLLYVHGGPLSQYSVGFFDEFQLAAAAGFTVIAGNPRGSDGYGQHHAEAIVGNLGDRDWADVSALADHLAGLDGVDPARCGIGGGSYGGFMTTWAIGHTARFAAALSERAVNNWETMQGTSDIGAWFTRQYLGASNLSDLEAVRRQSPMTYAASIVTPTLIVHSDEDWRCPPEQGEQLFVTLRMLGVPTQFIRIPGENHELTRIGRPSFRVERFGIVHDWFTRWLVNEEL